MHSCIIVHIYDCNLQESEGDQEHEQYKLLSDKINWFFTNLLIFGYVEDVSTGESFRMPCDSQWCVYVEVSKTHVHMIIYGTSTACVSTISIRSSFLGVFPY